MLNKIRKIPLEYLQLLLLVLLSVFIVWPTFMPGYFFHHDDLQVMRVFEMRKCFDTGQIPCRWVPDMGYGNGYPLFNYYSVLPYYIGGVASYVFGFVGAAKLLFFIPLFIGGFGMYFLGRRLYGDWGGFVAGVLYQFAPYRALDGYVRGAIAESFALAVIPFVFYYFLRLVQEKSRTAFIGSVVSLALFLMCHNIMTMFFIPILGVWIVILSIKYQIFSIKKFKRILFAGLLGIGLAAFFIFPVFLEKDLVRTETLLEGGSDFRAHFVTVPQIFFDRKWDFGGSQFGPEDTISFQVGWPHWWMVVVSGFVFLWLLLKRTKQLFSQESLVAIVMSGLFGLSLIFMHNKSAFIWEVIGPLQYAQFPWRFLAIAIFTASVVGGFVIYSLPKKSQLFVSCILVLATFFLNWQFFIPKDFYPWIDDHQKLSDPLWEIQQKAGLMDYLPKSAYYEPQGRAPEEPEIRSGKADPENYKVLSDSFTFKIKVDELANVEIPIIEYPNWKVFVNGKEYPHSDENHWGRLRIDLPPGIYEVSGKLYNTPIRTLANLMTLVSFGLLIMIITWKKFRKVVID
jgi:hypothetical protein